MASDASHPRATALDFATHNVWDGQDAHAECVETIKELVGSFGVTHVLNVVTQFASDNRMEVNSSDAVRTGMRNLCHLVIESDRPRLTAILVGRLVKLETAAGKRLTLRELGRDNRISKQAVSNRMKTYAERLQLPRLESTPESRKSHQLMNRRNYGTRPIEPALAHK